MESADKNTESNTETPPTSIPAKGPTFQPKGTGAICIGICHLSEDVLLDALVQAMDKVPLWVRENLKFKILDEMDMADSNGKVVARAIPRAVIFEDMPTGAQIVEGLADLFSFLCGPGPKEGPEGSCYLVGIYHTMQINHAQNGAGKDYWTAVVSLTEPLVVNPKPAVFSEEEEEPPFIQSGSAPEASPDSGGQPPSQNGEDAPESCDG